MFPRWVPELEVLVPVDVRNVGGGKNFIAGLAGRMTGGWTGLGI